MAKLSPTDTAEIRRWHEATGHAHASLLRWCRTVGYARHNGVGVDLYEPPALEGADIEYVAGRGSIDGRDMTAEELQAVRKLLVQMAEDARDALQGASTLAVVLKADA